MRCIFAEGKQRELLFAAKDLLAFSWRSLAKELNAGYTTLRDWRDEKYSLPLTAFQRLLELCPELRNFENYIVDIKKENWGRELGGLHAKKEQRGFFHPSYKERRQVWRRTGGRMQLKKWHKTMREQKPEEYRRIQHERLKKSFNYKYLYGGHKYRNLLELGVAKILTESRIQFNYEPMLKYAGNFYFPDFVANNNIIIECTFWHDAKQRAEELRQKIGDYKQLEIDKIIIVTSPKQVDEYSKLLENSGATVITINSLRNLLAGGVGRV